MSRILSALLCLAAILSFATARVAREAPQPTDTSITEFFAKAQEHFNNIQEAVLKSMGMSNTEELSKKATDLGKEFVAKLDVWVNNIKKETENFPDNENVKKLRESAEKLLEDFAKEHPKTTEELKALVDSTKQQTTEIMDKLKNLGESEDAQKLKEISANLLNSAAENFQNMAKEVQENLKQK